MSKVIQSARIYRNWANQTNFTKFDKTPTALIFGTFGLNKKNPARSNVKPGPEGDPGASSLHKRFHTGCRTDLLKCKNARFEIPIVKNILI
jgi:hypothetical protein